MRRSIDSINPRVSKTPICNEPEENARGEEIMGINKNPIQLNACIVKRCMFLDDGIVYMFSNLVSIRKCN